AEQAELLEELAQATYLVHRTVEAVPIMERAIALNAELGDQIAVGRCTRLLAHLLWFTGAGEAARWTARRALEILEPLGDSVELARAYSALAALEMLAPRCDSAIRWGERAIELARRVGDEQTRVSALVTIGTAKAQLHYADNSALVDAQREASAMGNHYESARALHNLGATALYWNKPDEARRRVLASRTYSEQHDMGVFVAYTLVNLAWLDLRAGAWDSAETIARAEMEQRSSIAQLLAREVATALALRRGDPGAFDALEKLIPEVNGT